MVEYPIRTIQTNNVIYINFLILIKITRFLIAHFFTQKYTTLS